MRKIGNRLKIIFLEIIEKWPETEKKWSILLDHSDIDAISTSISRLSVYIDAKDSTLALAEIASLKQLLKTIPDRGSTVFD